MSLAARSPGKDFSAASPESLRLRRSRNRIGTRYRIRHAVRCAVGGYVSSYISCPAISSHGLRRLDNHFARSPIPVRRSTLVLLASFHSGTLPRFAVSQVAKPVSPSYLVDCIDAGLTRTENNRRREEHTGSLRVISILVASRASTDRGRRLCKQRTTATVSERTGLMSEAAARA